MIQWRIFHIYVGLLEGNPPWPRRKGRWPQSGPWKFPQRIHHSTWGPWLCFVVWLQQRITQAFHKTNPGFYEMVNLEGVQAWAIDGYNPGHNSVTWDLNPVTMARYLVVPSIKKLTQYPSSVDHSHLRDTEMDTAQRQFGPFRDGMISSASELCQDAVTQSWWLYAYSISYYII